MRYALRKMFVLEEGVEFIQCSLIGARNDNGTSRGVLVKSAVLGILAASDARTAYVWLDDLHIMRIPIQLALVLISFRESVLLNVPSADASTWVSLSASSTARVVLSSTIAVDELREALHNTPSN